MQALFRCVAGLDVHNKTVVATIRVTDAQDEAQQKTCTFGTMTAELLALYDWLTERGVTHVAMESTGVLWKPVWNILEGGSWELLLVNARDLKHVPGHKTDVIDSRWIAQLLSWGLLKKSYVPQREQRDLRDLTRQRAQLHAEHTRCVNRIHKVLQDANIKLSSVATDILGASGRDMLAALIKGEKDPEALAKLARGKLRAKIPQLQRALHGHLTDHHQFMLQHLLDHVAHLESQLDCFSERIEKALRQFVDDATFERLDEIPGINRETLENVVAEIGVDMKQFPTEGHLASWAGVCPGNEESAGKRKRSRTTKGNVWLRRALCQAAWSASRTKDSYFKAQYARLAGRRGIKRAAMAVGHTLLGVIYHLLKDPTRHYADLGSNYFDTLNPERLSRKLVKRLESLGYTVVLTKSAA